MGGVIASFIQLVLEVPSKVTSDAIDKCLGIPKVLLEEVFELKLLSKWRFYSDTCIRPI